MVLIDFVPWKARALVTVSHFHPSLILAGTARSLLGIHYRSKKFEDTSLSLDSTLEGRLLYLPANIRQGWM
jgi:hypothetical protein